MTFDKHECLLFGGFFHIRKQICGMEGLRYFKAD